MNPSADPTDNYNELESEAEEDPGHGEVRPVSSESRDWTIGTLREQLDRGKIDLQPHYQRQYVWELKPELPSRLIESLLLRIPIPPLYFMSVRGSKIEVVDGQQRLTTLIRFIKNEFELQKLQKLSHLNGKYFKELSSANQEQILDAPIRSIVIDGSTNPELRYEIFERLNRGTMALNEQEIRNCAYRGLFCDLLAELEQDPNWRSVKGGSEPEPRFVEREMILRFFAFSARIDHYAGNLKRFLNDYMGQHAPSDKAKVAELGEMFRQTMRNVGAAFDSHAARLFYVADTGSLTSGEWYSTFSISALDIQASALIGHSTSKVRAAAQQIQELYKIYLASNPEVRIAISRRPATKDATRTRWFGFRTIVHKLMSSSLPQTASSDPLFNAEILFHADYHIPAGALAGVRLEQHLKDLCAKHTPASIRPDKDGINKANDGLRAANIFDQTQHRRIQVLGDIRNRCDHAVTTQPSRDEVRELLDGVRKFIQTYPL